MVLYNNERVIGGKEKKMWNKMNNEIKRLKDIIIKNKVMRDYHINNSRIQFLCNVSVKSIILLIN